jgi:hypothetical protein
MLIRSKTFQSLTLSSRKSPESWLAAKSHVEGPCTFAQVTPEEADLLLQVRARYFSDPTSLSACVNSIYHPSLCQGLEEEPYGCDVMPQDDPYNHSMCGAPSVWGEHPSSPTNLEAAQYPQGMPCAAPTNRVAHGAHSWDHPPVPGAYAHPALRGSPTLGLAKPGSPQAAYAHVICRDGSAVGDGLPMSSPEAAFDFLTVPQTVSISLVAGARWTGLCFSTCCALLGCLAGGHCEGSSAGRSRCVRTREGVSTLVGLACFQLAKTFMAHFEVVIT